MFLTESPPHVWGMILENCQIEQIQQNRDRKEAFIIENQKAKKIFEEQ